MFSGIYKPVFDRFSTSFLLILLILFLVPSSLPLTEAGGREALERY